MIGKIIGKYEILAEIGRGGMGIVYLGHQKSLNRQVAIKVLPPQLATDKTSVERFIQEANLIAKMNHENIIQIYDIEEQDQTYFIIMEYLDGASLDKIIRHKVLDFTREEMTGFIFKVCQALEATHKQGVIHRDVKSANIFITRDKRVKLMDFGISKIVSSTATTGSALGTPSYMSPEQAKGEVLTPATDIYSLGIVLYEILTQKLPFTGEDAFSVALKQINDTPIPPIRLDDSIPPYLNRCCLVAMSKDKTERFLNCEDMGNAILDKWPLYLIKKTTFSEQIKNLISGLFGDRMFLPGMTIISILVSLMMIQQIFMRHPEVFSKSFPAPEKILSREKVKSPGPSEKGVAKPELPLPEVKQMPPAPVVSQPLELKESELELLDMSIEGNHFQKAEELLKQYKTDYPQDGRLAPREEKFILQKKKVDILSQVEDLQQKKDYTEALSRLGSLLILFPADEVLKARQVVLEESLKKEKARQEFFQRLQNFQKAQDYENLEKEALQALSLYPEDPSFQSSLKEARDKQEALKQEGRRKEKLARIKQALEEAKDGEASILLNSALTEFPGDADLGVLQETLKQKQAQLALLDNLKEDEKLLGVLLNQMAEAFSKKNLKEYLSCLNPKDKTFYSSEKTSAENLFELTRSIFSSISIMKFFVEGEQAKVSLFWKMSAVFKEDDKIFRLFEKQLDVTLNKVNGKWLISGFIWVK